MDHSALRFAPRNEGVEALTLIRTAVHVHSDWSYDGKWPLERLAHALPRLGYRAALMTDHDVGFSQNRWSKYSALCRKISNRKILLIPGMEYSDSANIIHILVWGVSSFLGEGLTTEDLLSQVASHGGAAVFAHPTRRNAWRQFRPSWAPLLSGVEIWNRKADGVAPCVDAVRLSYQHELKQFVGLDFHRARQYFPLWMKICAEESDERAIVEAVRQGRFEPVALGIHAERYTRGLLGMASVLGERARKLTLSALRPIGAVRA